MATAVSELTERIPPKDEEGFYHSLVIAGFRLRVDWLWQSPLPATLDVLRELKVL